MSLLILALDIEIGFMMVLSGFARVFKGERC